MSEAFVDLTYRGLALGRRVKLTQVRPSTGYLELPAPMPVGTAIAIATDDGAETTAVVAEIHEQVGGATQAPGMLVRPALAGAFKAWWSALVTLPELEPAPEPVTIEKIQVAQVAAAGTVTVRPKRSTATPELADDGRHTAEMQAVSEPPLVDDGRRTIAMDAIDLAALGLEPMSASASGSMSSGAIVEVADDGESAPSDDAASRDSKPNLTSSGSVQKRKRKRAPSRGR